MKIKSNRRINEDTFTVNVDDNFSFIVRHVDSAYEAAKTKRLIKLTGYSSRSEFIDNKRGIEREEFASEFELFQQAEVKAERLATIDQLIVGWNAINEEDEKPIEFSKQNVIDLILNDKELEHIIDEATFAAFNESNFWSKKVNEAVEQIKKS